MSAIVSSSSRQFSSESGSEVSRKDSFNETLRDLIANNASSRFACKRYLKHSGTTEDKTVQPQSGITNEFLRSRGLEKYSEDKRNVHTGSFMNLAEVVIRYPMIIVDIDLPKSPATGMKLKSVALDALIAALSEKKSHLGIVRTASGGYHLYLRDDSGETPLQRKQIKMGTLGHPATKEEFDLDFFVLRSEVSSERMTIVLPETRVDKNDFSKQYAALIDDQPIEMTLSELEKTISADGWTLSRREIVSEKAFMVSHGKITNKNTTSAVERNLLVTEAEYKKFISLMIRHNVVVHGFTQPSAYEIGLATASMSGLQSVIRASLDATVVKESIDMAFDLFGEMSSSEEDGLSSIRIPNEVLLPDRLFSGPDSYKKYLEMATRSDVKDLKVRALDNICDDISDVVSGEAREAFREFHSELKRSVKARKDIDIRNAQRVARGEQALSAESVADIIKSVRFGVQNGVDLSDLITAYAGGAYDGDVASMYAALRSCIAIDNNANVVYVVTSNAMNKDFEIATRTPDAVLGMLSRAKRPGDKISELYSVYTEFGTMLCSCRGLKMICSEEDYANGYVSYHPGYYQSARRQIPKDKVPDLSEYFRFVRESICADDAETYRWFDNYLKNLFQTFDKGSRAQIAVIINGRHGCGKSILMERILCRALGSYGAKYESIEQLFGKFNGDIAGKTLVFVDEANDQSTTASRGLTDRIKDFITSSSVTIERKGVDKVKMDNVSSLIVGTNHLHAVPIEINDRRIVMLRCSDKWATITDVVNGKISSTTSPEWKRFNELYRVNGESLSQNFISTVAKYYSESPIDPEWNARRNVPLETELRTSEQIHHAKGHERFLADNTHYLSEKVPENVTSVTTPIGLITLKAGDDDHTFITMDYVEQHYAKYGYKSARSLMASIDQYLMKDPSGKGLFRIRKTVSKRVYQVRVLLFKNESDANVYKEIRAQSLESDEIVDEPASK